MQILLGQLARSLHRKIKQHGAVRDPRVLPARQPAAVLAQEPAVVLLRDARAQQEHRQQVRVAAVGPIV